MVLPNKSDLKKKNRKKRAQGWEIDKQDSQNRNAQTQTSGEEEGKKDTAKKEEAKRIHIEAEITTKISAGLKTGGEFLRFASEAQAKTETGKVRGGGCKVGRLG